MKPMRFNEIKLNENISARDPFSPSGVVMEQKPSLFVSGSGDVCVDIDYLYGNSAPVLGKWRDLMHGHVKYNVVCRRLAEGLYGICFSEPTYNTS